MRKKNQDLRAIAPKITEDAAQWYEDIFPSLNAGVTFMLEATPHLYAQGLSEMRGMFSRGELSMILDVLNDHGTLMAYGSPGGLAGQHITLSISDSFRLHPGSYEDKWGISDADGFVRRLVGLGRWHLVCLEMWAARFWQGDYNADNAVTTHCAPLV
jgi:hypothetical protein